MPKAVVCEKDETLSKFLTGTLKTLGFESVVPSTVEEASYTLQFDDISVFVLNEMNFNDAQRLFEEITNLPMYRRREIFFVLIGNKFATMDRFNAFTKGVNLLINIKDIQNFSLYFKRAYVEYQNLYKNFKEFSSKY